MSERQAALDCAEKLKALADKSRLAIMLMLRDGPKHVGEIMERLAVEQSLVSHHLKILRDRNLVVSARDGKRVLYRLAPGTCPDEVTRAIDLGCCSLSFEKTQGSRKA